jgi:hypothetical protein
MEKMKMTGRLEHPTVAFCFVSSWHGITETFCYVYSSGLQLEMIRPSMIAVANSFQQIQWIFLLINKLPPTPICTGDGKEVAATDPRSSDPRLTSHLPFLNLR